MGRETGKASIARGKHLEEKNPYMQAEWVREIVQQTLKPFPSPYLPASDCSVNLVGLRRTIAFSYGVA